MVVYSKTVVLNSTCSTYFSHFFLRVHQNSALTSAHQSRRGSLNFSSRLSRPLAIFPLISISKARLLLIQRRVRDTRSERRFCPLHRRRVSPPASSPRAAVPYSPPSSPPSSETPCPPPTPRSHSCRLRTYVKRARCSSDMTLLRCAFERCSGFFSNRAFQINSIKDTEGK